MELNYTPLCDVVLTYSHKRQPCEGMNLVGFSSMDYYNMLICSGLLTYTSSEKKQLKVKCIRKESKAAQVQCTELHDLHKL